MTSWYALHLVLIQQILVYGMLALGLQSAFIAGVFSMASIGFFTIGAFATGAVVLHTSVNPQLAILLVALGAVVLAWLFTFVIRGLSGLYLGMATFAFDFIVVGIVTNFFTKYTGGPVGLYGLTATVSTWEILVILIFFVLIASWMERRAAGRAIRAIRLDVPMARSLGVNVTQWQTTAFILSALYGTVAGSLYILAFGVISPVDVGFDLISLVLTMVVVGGRDSWFGAILGAAILTWLPTVLTFAAEWRPLVYGAAIVLVATYAPGGIVGIGQSITQFAVGRIRGGPAVPQLPGSGMEPEAESHQSSGDSERVRESSVSAAQRDVPSEVRPE
jgi:branched-chain amino acid transport system permease protein